MPVRRIINRNYTCRFCGSMRRAPANYLPGGPMGPQCCAHLMLAMTYEQTVAATQLSDTERAAWLSAGGEIVKRAGKRRWKAVW